MTRPIGEQGSRHQVGGASVVPLPATEPRVALLSCLVDADLPNALNDPAWTLIPCRDAPALLEAVVHRRPSAVVVGIAGECTDLGLLHLVRRAAPDVPLILIAGESDLGLQRKLLDMRPYYFDVMPFDPEALRDAVRLAVRPARARRPTK